MTGAVVAELARMVAATVACAAAVLLLLAGGTVALLAYPGPGRRYRGQHRAGDRVWSPC